jgi:hypothetical protein
MQIDHRVAAFLNELALRIGYFEAQGDGGIFFDFHGVIRFVIFEFLD